jgi:hypothetical protein
VHPAGQLDHLARLLAPGLVKAAVEVSSAPASASSDSAIRKPNGAGLDLESAQVPKNPELSSTGGRQFQSHEKLWQKVAKTKPSD